MDTIKTTPDSVSWLRPCAPQYDFVAFKATLLLLLLVACTPPGSDKPDAGSPVVDAGTDGGTTPPADAGTDGGTTPPADAGTDGGTTPPADAGTDGGTTPPADAGTDGGTTPPADAGTDGGTTPPADAGTDGGTTPPADGGLSVGTACSTDEWCWENPTPYGDSLQAAWGSAANDLWVGGEGGYALRWNGNYWTVLYTGLSESLRVLSGSSASNLWAGGATGDMARWDGSAWRVAGVEAATGRSGLFISSPTEGWMTQAPSGSGSDGRLWRLTAAGWTSVPNAAGWNLSALWGLSSTDVRALAGSSGLSRWDGNGWVGAGSLPSLPSSERYTALWVAPGATAGWAVASNGAVARLTGSGWGAVSSPRAVRLNAVWGSGADDVVMVGNQGTLLHWNGQTLSLVDTGTQADLLAVRGTDSADVWVFGHDGTMLHRGASGWRLLRRDLAPGVRWVAMTGTAEDDVWVFGNEGSRGAALRWNGQTWRVATPPPGPVNAAWAAGPQDVWAVGTSAYRWTGQQWTTHTLPAGFNARGIHGTGPTDIWIVSDTGARVRWDGMRWVAQDAAAQPLYDVWAMTPYYVWAVGAQGQLELFDGAVWTPAGSSSTHTLRSVWGSTDDDVWAVGDRGVIIRYNGITFNVDTTSAGGVSLYEVWGRSATDIWAVGEGGVLLHYDGQRWRRQLSGTARPLTTVWGAGRSTWTAGSSGQVLRRTR